MRWIVVVATLCLFACGNGSSKGGGGGGAGGTDETPGGSGGTGGGGTGGTGGTGGGETDPVAPTLDIAEPEDGATFVDPDVIVRGVAADDRGLARVWWVDQLGIEQDLPVNGTTEVPFEFAVRLDEGTNEISVFAEDAAGNEAEAPLVLELENPEGRPAQIEAFAASRTWVERGDAVDLRWTVTGTRPIDLWLYDNEGRPVDVSDRSGKTVQIDGEPVTRYLLRASNRLGEAWGMVEVGVGEELQLWPRGATILPGARQVLAVDNLPYGMEVEWTVSGGELGESTDPWTETTWFRAGAVGEYTVTVTTAETPPRTASTTITVAEIPSAVAGFRGVGGQFGRINRWDPDMGVDGQGNLWIPAPGAGLARWSPVEGRWLFEGDTAWADLRSVHELANGDLLAIGDTVRRLERDADRWTTIVDHAPNELYDPTVGPDGTLYAMDWSIGPSSPILVFPPGATAGEELPGPGELWRLHLAFGADGGLYLAGKDEANLIRVYRLDETGEWLDTGPVPNPTESIEDLLVGADGHLYLAGRTLARLRDGAWEPLGDFPTCAENDLCGLFDLELRSDGTLLVVERSEVYEQRADGTFAVVGTSIPEMHTPSRILGALRNVTEAPDGTLYLQGDLGVYALPGGEGTWRVLGEPGIMPFAETNDLIVEPDGGWTLASGGWGGHELYHSLYRRDAAGGPWVGFGNEIGDITFPDVIFRIGRDGSGDLYGFGTLMGRVFVLDAETNRVERHLPWDEKLRDFADDEVLFGVAADGTVYVGGRDGGDFTVLRLRPGAETWTVDPNLFWPRDFERAPDGSFWVVDGYPMRLRTDGRWEEFGQGLPRLVAAGNDLFAVEDGSLLLAEENGGVYRLEPGASVWRRVGFGEPSLGASRVTSRAGRTWAVAGGRVYELDGATQCWVPVDGPVAWSPSVFAAADDGSLLLAHVGGYGLLQSYDVAR
jgi:hypothetical protein